MTTRNTNQILSQIDELIARFESIERRKKYLDYSDIDPSEASELVVSGIAAIQRCAGANSPYYRELKEVIEKIDHYRAQMRIPHVGGALKAVRAAIVAGYLVNYEELIHANLFSDFLEMAGHLLEEGYKDPAAVVIGSVLEEHLRKLCLKNTIDVEITDHKGVRPKKADTLNGELAGKGVYNKLDQKSIISWLDLRNKAAHGKYSEYSLQQVEILLSSVRDFVARNPA